MRLYRNGHAALALPTPDPFFVYYSIRDKLPKMTLLSSSKRYFNSLSIGRNKR